MNKKIKTILMLSMFIPAMMLFTSYASAGATSITITNPHPTNGTTGVPLSPAYFPVTCFVNDSNGSMMTYRMWYHDGATFYWGSNLCHTHNATFTGGFIGLVDDYNTTYYWGITANDSFGGVANITFHFTTRHTAPNKPTSLTPANNSINIPISGQLLSCYVTDPDGFNMTVTFYVNSVPQSSAFNIPSGVTVNSFPLSLLYNTVYTWYVIANNSFAQNTSVTYTFTTAINHIAVISNPIPHNNATGISITLGHLSININDPDGDTMDWDILTLPIIGVNGLNFDTNGTKICNITNPLNYSSTYFWHVDVTDTGTHTLVSHTYKFTTEAKPSLSGTTNYLTHDVLSIVIAVAILMAIVGIAFTVGATKEGLITIMMVSIIGIIIIQIIMSL